MFGRTTCLLLVGSFSATDLKLCGFTNSDCPEGESCHKSVCRVNCLHADFGEQCIGCLNKHRRSCNTTGGIGACYNHWGSRTGICVVDCSEADIGDECIACQGKTGKHCKSRESVDGVCTNDDSGTDMCIDNDYDDDDDSEDYEYDDSSESLAGGDDQDTDADADDQQSSETSESDFPHHHRRIPLVYNRISGETVNCPDADFGDECISCLNEHGKFCNTKNGTGVCHHGIEPEIGMCVVFCPDAKVLGNHCIDCHDKEGQHCTTRVGDGICTSEGNCTGVDVPSVLTNRRVVIAYTVSIGLSVVVSLAVVYAIKHFAWKKIR